jgi:hypothetical protein
LSKHCVLVHDRSSFKALTSHHPIITSSVESVRVRFGARFTLHAEREAGGRHTVAGIE